MAFQFFQVPTFVETSEKSQTRTERWRATGSSSSSYVNSYARSATAGVIATIYGTLWRQDIQLKQTAYNQWDVTVPYGPRKNETGEWTWDFDTTGGSVHITNGKEEVGRFPADKAPDQKGAIGVDGDQVHGTEIIIPAMKINVQYKHPLGVITIPQAKFLASITGTVSNETFLTFAPGEVLFLGARGSDGTVADATVTYQFAMSSNATGQTIGGIAGVAKRGWDEAWIKYEDDTAAADGKDYAVRVPKFVYVNRVYDETPLATALGFGG